MFCFWSSPIRTGRDEMNAVGRCRSGRPAWSSLRGGRCQDQNYRTRIREPTNTRENRGLLLESKLS